MVLNIMKYKIKKNQNFNVNNIYSKIWKFKYVTIQDTKIFQYKNKEITLAI